MPLLIQKSCSQYPNMVIPKFKVPDFDKYKGTTCPKNHLKMYCRKMGAYAKDEELPIHFFQESLTRVAVTWYANLEPSRVHSWMDLMVAFVKQYQYSSDMASDRMQLQIMKTIVLIMIMIRIAMMVVTRMMMIMEIKIWRYLKLLYWMEKLQSSWKWLYKQIFQNSCIKLWQF